MPELKLGKLPDRTPVKFTFRASPELAQMLNEYGGVYRTIYRQPDETIEELIPYMLMAFMEADLQFKKARKEVLVNDFPGLSEPHERSNLPKPKLSHAPQHPIE